MVNGRTVRFLTLLFCVATFVPVPAGNETSHTETCVFSHGYWKSHASSWPQSSLVLGDPALAGHTYQHHELLSVLEAPSAGDASLILAAQLIAAKLNVASGASAEPIMGWLTRADALLSIFRQRLPYRVKGNSPVGSDMVVVAKVLEQFNLGAIAGSCGLSNTAPVANAGPDQSVFVGVTVTLDASASSDADGQALAFRWAFVSRPSGSAATLSDAAAARPTFVPDVTGNYDVQLIVSDGSADSAPSVVRISTINSRPIANAGLDQTAPVGGAISLNGAASSDPDGDALTFLWSIASRPAGSTAVLVNPQAAAPSLAIDVPGQYLIDLIVSDGALSSVPDAVTISTVNSAPVARAGADAGASVGNEVALDGSGSTDVDGDALTYRWTLTSRPATSETALANATTVTPNFVPDVPGDYVVELIVNDANADSAPDTVVINTARANTPPVAYAGLNQSAITGDVVQLDGSGSTDIDGDPLTFAWSFTTVPAGSAAAFADPAAVQPTFTPDIAGAYVAQLIVSDPSASSTPSTVTVNVQPQAPDNRAPLADAGTAQTVQLNGVAVLDGSGSSDPDGDPLTYSWSLLARPAGSVAALSDPTAIGPSFTVDIHGTYVAQLIVNDGAVNSAPDTVSISTQNSAPTADAGDDASVALGATVQLDGSGSLDPDGASLTYSWALTTRPAGSNATLSDAAASNPTFVADIDGPYVAQLIVSDGVLVSGPDTITVTAAQGTDLRVRLSGQTAPPVGSTHSWIIELHNLGNADASDIRIRAALPAGYTFAGVNTFGFGSYDPATGIWTRGSMINGAGAFIIIDSTVNATGPHDLEATIIESSVPDPVSANNTATLNVTPNASADLRMSFFTFEPGTRLPGTTLTFFVDVFNAGPARVSGVEAEFRVPDGFTVLVTNPNGIVPTSYDGATGIWSIGTLANGVVARLVLTVQMNALGSIVLRGSITNSSGPDPDLTNNVITPARHNRPPVAMAGADQAVSTHAVATLNGGASFDADGDPITFQWTTALRPINSATVLSTATAPSLSMTPDLPGNYITQLVVTDSFAVASVPDSVTVTASTTNRAPVFVTTPGRAASTGQAYLYDADAADPDTGDLLTFSLATAPAGMTINGATGAITWTPTAEQAGQQNVVVRVQDVGGLFALQAVALQVASPGNGAPLAVDDDYSVRLSESLSVAAPGVLDNDTDEDALAARLVSPPSNGAVLLNQDGSFTYTPHVMNVGEFVLADNVNLAARIPGVTVSPANPFCPRCAIDESVLTNWNTGGNPLEIVFPAGVTVNKVNLVASRNPNDHKISAGIFELFDGGGVELYDSGPVEIVGPLFDATLILPGLPGVRRVRFTPTASPTANVFFSTLAELRVIGSGMMSRQPFDEPNLVQRLAATVSSNSVFGFNTAEGLIDDAPSNWYSNGNVGDFIEVTFPIEVAPTQLVTSNPNGRPDGFGSSNGMDCSGTFTVLDASRTILFDSGVINEPSGFPHSSDTFSLSFPPLAGVRHIRYTAASPCSGIFPHGFSEWRVFGTADVTTPAFGLGKKFQALIGREAHSTPIVVNLTDDNGDGAINAGDVPDIIVPVEAVDDQLRGEIKAVSGDDGRELFTAGGPNLVSPWSELAAGDIDGDGLPEIVAVHSDGNHLIAFEHTGVLKWTSDAHAMPSFNLGAVVYTGAISIANLDGVGAPEIIVGASVFDADGHLLGDGRTLGGTTGGTGLRSAISAIANIDLEGLPELVAGPTAYRLSGGQLTKVWQRTDRADGYVGIANLDDDPQAEIVTVANGVVYVLNHDGSDDQGWNSPAHSPVPIPGGGQGGAPLIVDVDADGVPEIGVAAASQFVLFNRDGGIRWRSAISDRTSNSTGAVAFDLNGDGQVEVIYRDEYFLRIYRGSDGVLLAKTPVGSATWSEEPVVADVDNDGHADLVVSSDFFRQSQGDTGIIVFQDVANKWQRTRRIWNQHSYHVTNVTEDATIPLTESAHWLVPGLNNFRTNAFVSGESADATDSFTYLASDGVLESNPATVRIAIRTPNSGPQITSTPVTAAADGVSYAYAAAASDPDAGDILTFSMPTAPQGMSIDPASGLIAWVPAASQQGAHRVVLKVADVRGLFALQGFEITVATAVTVPDVVGQVQAAAQNAITSASLTIGSVTTRHAAGTPLGSVVTQNPAGGSSAAAGTAVSLVVSLGPPPVGTVPTVVGLAQAAAQQDVTAAGFTSTATGQNNSAVPVGVVMSQNPAGGTIAPSTTVVSLVVSLGPPPGELDLDLDGFTGDQGDCNDTNPAFNPAAFDIPGDGIDQNCNGVDSIAGDNTPPTASIAIPADDATITMPTDILGTATDSSFLRYRVLVAGVDAETFVEIGVGTTAVSSGVLGRLDPTLLENGLYRVRLIVEDVNGQHATDERVYRVDGEAKVGVFAISFVDLMVPLAGVPISVVRGYDSRVKTSRDFGVGWDLQVTAGSYRHNRTPGEGWIITDQPFLGEQLPCIGGSLETRSHVTEVRLSDRESYFFALAVTNGNLGITGACEGTASFRFLSGTLPGATLDILGPTSVFYLRGGADEVVDAESFFAGAPRPYDPRTVRLTTIDGRVIELDRTAGITRLLDTNGNAIDITDAGIVHSSGRSIAFTRDSLGRIVRITDPVGRQLSYEYTGGDLTAFVDQSGARTTFSYDARHNLTEITDPLGNRAVRSEYDAAGRLVAVIDARGGRTEFAHDISGRSEVITDALGNESRVTYDERGNVRTTESQVTIDGATVPVRTESEYDANGNETVIIDPDGRRLENVWDALGNQISSVVDPAGLQIRQESTYSAAGHLLTAVDPNGDTTRLTVDAKGNATAWIDVDGRSTLIAHNANGDPTRVQDPDGRVTQVSYDGAGRALTRIDALGHVTSYTYDAAGNRLTETVTRTIDGSQRQLTTRFEYDSRNRLTRITDALGRSTTTAYNVLGRVASTTDALGRTTSYEYDEVGAVVRSTYPDGTTELKQYDARGDLVESTDRDGLVTRHSYDQLRRRVATILPGGAVMRTTFSPGGLPVATVAPDGARTDYEYDAARRKVLTRAPAVPAGPAGTLVRPQVRYEYDPGGRLVAETDPNGNRKEIAYDSAARSVTGRLADGSQVTEFRDQWNRPLRRVDQEGREISFSYVADTGWLSAVTLPAAAPGQTPPTWQFAYDEVGNRVSQTDPLGRLTRFSYDETGRLRRVTLPGGEARSLAYDAIGRITALTDYDGQSTAFEYDLADRLTARRFANGTSVRFTYTPGGKRASAEDARGITAYQYDAAGRLSRIEQPGAGTIDYTHDVNSRVTSIAAPGATTAYAYDALGRLVQVTGTTGTTAYEYDPAGNLAAMELPNGVTATMVYDNRSQLTTLRYERAGALLSTFGYSYTPAGRRSSVTETGATTSFAYDGIGRLTGETRLGTSSFTRQYEYDLAGNRTRTVTNGLPVSSAYDANDRLLTAGSIAFAYDARGNVVSRNQAGAVTTFAWTPDNRLASVSNVSGTVGFQYDADGMRVAKSSASSDVRYLVDPRNPTGLRQTLEERDPSGGLVATHEYGLNLLSSTRSGATRFALSDGQTSIRQLADATGQVTDEYAYDAFGNSIIDAGSTENDRRAIGQQLDEETGLYYLRERYYDPAIGRFLGRDPVDGDPTVPASLHRYSYAGNDPVNFADPNGDFFTLLGLSFASIVDTGLRGLDVSRNLNTICRLKAFAKVVPMLVGIKQAAASRFGFAEKLFELVTPSVGLGSLANPQLSPGLSFKESFFEHPLAKQTPVSSHLAGELKSVEFEIKVASLTGVDLELTAAEFPNTSVKLGPIGCQLYPSFQITSFAAGLGFEKVLHEIRVCGALPVGTLSGVFSGSVGASGFNFSSSSLEAGFKVAVTFMPELTFNLFKIPEDMR